MQNKNNEVIVVSGLTRCGSSLMMQMLYSGGCKVSCADGNELISGEHEDQLSALREIALGLVDGEAIKCLDPHRFPLPPGRKYRIIWMRRNFSEQAKSITKFIQMLIGVKESKRSMARKFEKQLPDETRQCLKILSKYPIIEINFEDLLSNPKEQCERIVTFLHGIVTLDINKMTSVVIDRSPECYPGMLESYLIQKHEQIKP